MSKSKQPLLNLTQSQLSLWTSQKLHHNVPLHNVVHTFEIKGDINERVFEMAFQQLLKSHDVLRTKFIEIDGIPYQSFEDNFSFDLEVVDFTSDFEEALLDRWISERAKKMFDISRRSFDSALLKIEDERYIWFLNLHHLITDGVTTTMFYAHMSSIYGKISNDDPETTYDSTSFREYIRFANDQKNNPENEASHSYWKEKISGLDEPPRLYGVQNKGITTDAHRISVPLGGELSNRLKELAQRDEIKGWTKDSTLFTIFSTLYFIYLYRISGQRKLAVGTTVHNRTNKTFRKTAGFFIEVFPFVNALYEDDTFLSVSKRIKAEANGFLKNVKPGVFDLGMTRNTNVILNYIMTRFSDFNGFPMKSRWVHTGHMNSTNQMELHIVDKDNQGEFELVFDINASILDEDDRINMPNHFVMLLRAFVEDMHQSIHKPNLLSDSEFDSTLLAGNKTVGELLSIIKDFEIQVSKSPENKALQHKDFSLTYQTLNEESNRLAHYLAEQNIKGGSRVIVLLKRSPEYVISLLAILKTGATFVPVPINYPEERIQYIIDDCHASLLISSSAILNSMNFPGTRTTAIDNLRPVLRGFSTSNLPLDSSLDTIAFLIYTSGSTGKPKGVKITNRALANYIHWTNEAYIQVPFPAIPLFTSVGFDITANSVFLPLICGGSIHVYEETDLQNDLSILDVIKDNKVDFVKLTPAHLSFLKGQEYIDTKIKVIVVTGDEFKTELGQSIYQAFKGKPRIYNEYGPAEATIGCIYHEFTPNINSIGVPIGVPIHNMEVYILDDNKNPVPKGVIGEIYLTGTGLADGYWERPTLTEEKFVLNPFKPDTKMYRTQDLGRLNADDVLEFFGRTDFQVKINGHRIELGEIEQQITSFESIDGSVVMLDERNGLKNLSAYFTAKVPIKLPELRLHLSKRLPRYMIPLYYLQIEEFPLSSNGKVDRKSLRTLNTCLVDSKMKYTAPRSEIEEVLAKIWQEVLGVPKVGVHDNFIALGGHSLMAIRITTRINKEIETNFSLNKIFELPSIAEYAKFIEETLSSLLEE